MIFKISLLAQKLNYLLVPYLEIICAVPNINRFGSGMKMLLQKVLLCCKLAHVSYTLVFSTGDFLKRSSMPQAKTRPDSPVPSLQGPRLLLLYAPPSDADLSTWRSILDPLYYCRMLLTCTSEVSVTVFPDDGV